MTKIVLIVVAVILTVILLPELVFAFVTKLDGMLYIMFGMFCNLMKLLILIGMFAVIVLTIVLIIKGIKAKK